MSKKTNDKKLSKEDFKDVILSDFRLVNEVRESSLLGRREMFFLEKVVLGFLVMVKN